ncbi:MAG: TRAM domain-containing protein [Parachlamydiaceae bacterium]
MNQMQLLIRIIFTLLCPLLLTLHTTQESLGGFNFANVTIGVIGGLGVSGILMALEAILSKLTLRYFNTLILGLFCGYLLAQALLLPLNSLLASIDLPLPEFVRPTIQIGVYLFSLYFGVILTLRGGDTLQFVIPFIKLEPASKKKKDIVIDSSTLLDTRIIDLALTGLLDNHLIIPRFVLKEFNLMNEQGDEAAKAKARRGFEVLRKLESIPNLNIRYIETDFPELKDSTTKLSHLARIMDASIITADLGRPQQQTSEGIRTVNIHALSNAFKAIPQSGEYLTIKIQRKGKEPGQGVGYLEDGTMVVVNGGEEFIFDTIRAQILSVKSTSSGRMVFCNAAEDDLSEPHELADAVSQMEQQQKNYFAAHIE